MRLRAGDRIAPKAWMSGPKQGSVSAIEDRRRNSLEKTALFSEMTPMETVPVGRYLLLWLLGIPIPILILIPALGGLH